MLPSVSSTDYSNYIFARLGIIPATIPALRRMKQEDCRFKGGLAHISINIRNISSVVGLSVAWHVQGPGLDFKHSEQSNKIQNNWHGNGGGN